MAKAKTRLKTRRWVFARDMKTTEDCVIYLDAALEDGDPSVIVATLGAIARLRGMADVARETGLGRESLYKALSDDGNPALSTVLKVVSALGLRLHASVA